MQRAPRLWGCKRHVRARGEGQHRAQPGQRCLAAGHKHGGPHHVADLVQHEGGPLHCYLRAVDRTHCADTALLCEGHVSLGELRRMLVSDADRDMLAIRGRSMAQEPANGAIC